MNRWNYLPDAVFVYYTGKLPRLSSFSSFSDGVSVSLTPLAFLFVVEFSAAHRRV